MQAVCDLAAKASDKRFLLEHEKHAEWGEDLVAELFAAKEARTDSKEADYGALEEEGGFAGADDRVVEVVAD